MCCVTRHPRRNLAILKCNVLKTLRCQLNIYACLIQIMHKLREECYEASGAMCYNFLEAVQEMNIIRVKSPYNFLFANSIQTSTFNSYYLFTLKYSIKSPPKKLDLETISTKYIVTLKILCLTVYTVSLTKTLSLIYTSIAFSYITAFHAQQNESLCNPNYFEISLNYSYE